MSHETYRRGNEAIRYVDRKYVKSFGKYGKCAMPSCYRVTEKMKKANAFRRFVCEHCMLGPQVNEELDEAEETRMSDAKLTCPASKCYALSSPRQFINGECCEDAKKHQRKALVIDAHRAYLNSRLEEDEATLELFDAEKRVSSAKMKLRRAEEELKDAQKEANSTRQNILRRREVTLAKRRKLDEEAATVCREEKGPNVEVRVFGPEDIKNYQEEDKSSWAPFK
ncbi:Oidioi.mRNA.OKI2018_I69.XSR.g15309.t1.cds [Oikopleura dioica]|uniref:Oidioi.mRNA.OKI2018_I69.XSR.g15309.t1.cds n=1 Tax=Oikopleura dioica TaxID=34765 RepID=A0ABN7SGG0_OIKDI|nr:Oidioi.mRNA.OKI2018_I69.XSR.g15309.t1.cds [Oikopleura dioica]